MTGPSSSDADCKRRYEWIDHYPHSRLTLCLLVFMIAKPDNLVSNVDDIIIFLLSVPLGSSLARVISAYVARDDPLPPTR
jgi:hypothetical protein